jgi:TPR repeat protein
MIVCFSEPTFLQGMLAVRLGWALNCIGARWDWSAIISKRFVLFFFWRTVGTLEALTLELQARWLQAAAAQNDPDALYNMAVLHAYGHGGTPVNSELARQYFERAAALDFAPAKNGLAMFLSQSGSEKDLHEAFKLFNESAALGNADGHYNKGILLRQGIGVEQDPVAARLSLQAAADMGHPSASVMLAEMLVAGEGGPDDHLGALLLLKFISGVHCAAHAHPATTHRFVFTSHHRNGSNRSRAQPWHQGVR